jgi:hypothetical protein
VQSSLKDTQALHDILGLLILSVQEKTADIALSYEVALQTSTEKLNNEVEVLMTALSVAVGSSVTLRNQMVS